MPELQLARPGHAPALLVSERENRACSAAAIPDRGDEFFAESGARHAQLPEGQAARTDHFHVPAAESGEVAGRVNLTDAADGPAGPGYRIAQKAAGQGPATAAVREVREPAAAQYGLTMLRAKATTDNPASHTVPERNGLLAAGELTPNGKTSHVLHPRALLTQRPQRMTPRQITI
jgi:ribosomal-protein-alanine N-acetyltransferase